MADLKPVLVPIAVLFVICLHFAIIWAGEYFTNKGKKP